MAVDQEPLVIWTVYERPEDFPEDYVARKFLIMPNNPVPTGEIILGKTLAAVRATLRRVMPGGVRLARDDSDPPSIVETYV